MDRDAFERRLGVLLAVIAGLLGVLALRLWQVQIVQGEYYLRLSEENRLRVTPIAAPRGLIVDRRGRPLVENRPAFTVAVLPTEFRHPDGEIPVLSRILGVDPAEVARKLNEARARPFAPVPLRRDVPKEVVAAVEESRIDLPGVVVEAEPVREYPYHELAAHLLGYVGEVSEQDLRAFPTLATSPATWWGRRGWSGPTTSTCGDRTARSRPRWTPRAASSATWGWSPRSPGTRWSWAWTSRSSRRPRPPSETAGGRWWPWTRGTGPSWPS